MDKTTELLSSYACNLSYEDLDPATVHQIKRTLVDTLGCAMGGYLSEPAKIARRLAGSVTSSMPSRILGTEDYSSMDQAGFANGVMVRYLDCNDAYFSPGGGHPSDMIPAALAVGDTLSADGKTLITAIALAYEVFCRIADQVPDSGWDQGLLCVIGAAWAAGKVMGLEPEQMADAIALAVIDIALSDGSGFDLAKSLLSVDPQLRLVLMTGLGNVAVPNEIEGQVLAVLAKLFRLEELAATLSAATSPAQGDAQ